MPSYVITYDFVESYETPPIVAESKEAALAIFHSGNRDFSFDNNIWSEMQDTVEVEETL